MEHQSASHSTQSGPYPAYHAYPHAHSPSLNDPVNCAPLKMGLDDSAYQSEPIDDVTSLLSRTHLDSHPTATTALRRLSLPPPEDGIYRVIRDVLTQDLETENNNEMICPDHPCFDISRKYARRWRISDQAIDNHIRLACGYLKFPVIMLLNPSPNQERLSFDEMVRECKTLTWIQRVLRETGLTLAEVIILHICTLLDDRRILMMDENEKTQAMYEAYNVTREMLQMIKPKIIVSCQCSTFGIKWGGGTHEIAKKLCSSMRGAERGQVNETYIEGHKIHVVQAYHPGGFLNHSSHEDPKGERLKRLFLRVYRPCGWELKRKAASPSLGAAARDKYTNLTSNIDRHTVPPRSNAETHFRPVSNSLPDVPRTVLSTMSSLPPKTHPFSSGLLAYDQGTRQPDIPPFLAQENLHKITSNGNIPQTVWPQIEAKFEKGFFYSADKTWTCYRRNYFAIQCSFSLSPPCPGLHLYLNRSGKQQPEQIQCFAMSLSAAVDGSNDKTIELIQHTFKRDKGPQLQIRIEKLAPSPLGKSQLDNSDSSLDMCHNPVAGMPVLPLQSNQGQTFASTNHSRTTHQHTFERIQFKSATANNGKRRARQQYYYLIVELYADVRGFQETQPNWVKIAQRASPPVVVRGRSPSHYQNEGSHAQRTVEPPFTGHLPGFGQKSGSNFLNPIRDDAGSSHIRISKLGAALSTSGHVLQKVYHATGTMNSSATQHNSPLSPLYQAGLPSGFSERAEPHNQPSIPSTAQVTEHFQDGSSISSIQDLDTSSVSALSSKSSISTMPLDISDQLVNLLLEDRGFEAMCRDGFRSLDAERFERNLRRLLRHYSAALRRNASVGLETAAAKHVKRKSRHIANIIRRKLVHANNIESDGLAPLLDTGQSGNLILKRFLEDHSHEPQPDNVTSNGILEYNCNEQTFRQRKEQHLKSLEIRLTRLSSLIEVIKARDNHLTSGFAGGPVETSNRSETEAFPQETSEDFASNESSSDGENGRLLTSALHIHTVQEFLLKGDPFEDLREGLMDFAIPIQTGARYSNKRETPQHAITKHEIDETFSTLDPLPTWLDGLRTLKEIYHNIAHIGVKQASPIYSELVTKVDYLCTIAEICFFEFDLHHRKQRALETRLHEALARALRLAHRVEDEVRKDFSRALEDRYEHAETHKLSRAEPPESAHNILHEVFSVEPRAVRLSPKFLPTITSQTNSKKSPPDGVQISTSDKALELLSAELNGLSLALRDLRSEHLTRLAPPGWNANYVLIEEIFLSGFRALNGSLDSLTPLMTPLEYVLRVPRKLRSSWRRMLRPRIQPGFKRIYWTCDCGEELYGDFDNTDTLAVDRLAAALRATAPGCSSGPSCAPHNQNPGPSTLDIQSTTLDSSSHLPCIDTANSAVADSRQDGDLSGTNSSKALCPPRDHPKYIELCVNTGGIYVTLVEIEVSSALSDASLFHLMKQAYHKHRGFRSRFAFLIKPVWVEFVQFSLWNMRQGYVSICDRPRSIPPKEALEWHYAPRPLVPLPPMPPEVFIHYLEHGQEDLNPNRSIWSPRLPKRLDGRIIDCDVPTYGWGIHIVEGPNKEAVFWIVIITVLGSILASILWSAIHKDIQGGTGLGTLIIALPPVIMAAFLFRLGGA